MNNTILLEPYAEVMLGTNTEAVYTDFNQSGEIVFSEQEYKYIEELIESLKYQWEDSLSDGKLFISSFDEIDKYNIVHSFANKLLQDLENIDPSFADVINENFWDLI